MNHREPPHEAGRRKALHCLSHLLASVLATECALVWSRQALWADEPKTVSETYSNPYLPMSGAPPLRFQEATPPPDLATRPPAAAPPKPAPVEILAATDPAIAEPSKKNLPADHAVPAPKTELVVGPTSAAPVKASPPSILPDDTRPQVRAEDFLPFFQMPGGSSPGELTVVVPVPPQAQAPGSLPPSSATYIQK